MEERAENKTFNLILKILFGVLIVLAMVKILFVGYDMDEQYAYAIAYRLLKKDLFIGEMWEPHQSSAFFQALLMALYMKIFGTTGVVLFSRTVGMAVHGLLMLLLYKNIKKRVSTIIALATVTIVAFTIPKLMFTADFSNLLMWNLLIVILSFDAYYRNTRKIIYLIAAGTALMFAVLSYPSEILLVIPCAIVILTLKKDKSTLAKEILALALPCVIGLIVFGIFVFMNVKPELFGECISYVLSDGSHSSGILSRISDNAKSLLTVLMFGALYGIIALVLCFIMRKKRAVNWENMMWSVLFVSMAGQLVIWIFADKYINFPRVELFFLAAYLFIKGTVKFKNVEKRKDFLLFTLLPLTAFLGVSIFTNHPFLASAPFLSYVIVGFVLQSEKEEKASKIDLKMVIICVGAFVIIFGNLYLVRTADGKRCTIFDDISLIRKGPAFGIVADDKIAVRYRDDYDLITENVPENSKVLYLGRDSDIYMFGDYEVCTPSTISTPTYEDNMEAYYEINPNKTPQYVIYENAYINQYENLFGDEYAEIASNYFIHIMSKKQ